ncbi:hypothetical protein AB7V88_15095 [Providencia rettgeri]
MTVSTEISSNEYTGNGVTTDFDYKFRIFKANQLSVITSDADGDNVVTLRLGTDYTVTGANKSAGGKVILTKPLANGHKISIARDIPITQETSFRNQGKFFAETHEDAFDYLTMIIQRIWGSLGSLYLKRPNILANWFDAKGYRIANLGKPKRDTDAVDLGTLKDEIEGVNSTILKKEKRTLRVDDMDVLAFPKVSERRNKQIGFDHNGIPTLLDPAETGVLGYAPVDSFEKGATLTSRYQVLFWEGRREYFRWDGKLPKVVPPNSTPHETGGIKTIDNPLGLWVDIGDASVRTDLIKTRTDIIGGPIFPASVNSYINIGDTIGSEYPFISTEKGIYFKGNKSLTVNSITHGHNNLWVTVNDDVFLRHDTLDGASAEKLGVYSSESDTNGDDNENKINECLPFVKKIIFKSGKTYLVKNSVFIDHNQRLLSEDESIPALIKLNSSEVLKTGIIESKGFPFNAVRNIEITVNVEGNLLQQPVGVPDVKGGEGCGLRLAVGTSRVKTQALYTAGVGVLFSDGGNKSLYTHVNNLHVVASYTGHEGIIFDAGYDQRCSYLESYFSWDSNRDFDYTKNKRSLATNSDKCAGILFYSGSAEVLDMHPSNNRHGYAWATDGRSGDSFRLRFTRAIGEGSAGGVLLAYTDDVTGTQLNCHSTRGKSGLPLFYARSGNNLSIALLDIKVDAQSGYPADGTKYAFVVDGESVNLPNVNIWHTGVAKADTCMSIKGKNHLIKGKIKGGNLAVSFEHVTEGAEIDLKIVGANSGVRTVSTNTKLGFGKVTFTGVGEPFSGDSYRFLSNHSMKNIEFTDTDTNRTNAPQVFETTIPAANLNDTVRTVSISRIGKVFDYTAGQRYHQTKTESLCVVSTSGVGGNYNVTAEGADSVTVQYRMTGSNDVILRCKSIYLV